MHLVPKLWPLQKPSELEPEDVDSTGGCWAVKPPNRTAEPRARRVTWWRFRALHFYLWSCVFIFGCGCIWFLWIYNWTVSLLWIPLLCSARPALRRIQALGLARRPCPQRAWSPGSFRASAPTNRMSRSKLLPADAGLSLVDSASGGIQWRVIAALVQAARELEKGLNVMLAQLLFHHLTSVCDLRCS